MDNIGHLVDENLKTIRWIVLGTGLAGVIVVIRSTRLASRFSSASQIPLEFFKKEISLHGKVRKVEPSGTIYVEHIPVIQVPWSKKPTYTESSGLLPVRLAALKTTPQSVEWMEQHLKDSPVFFKLLNSQTSTTTPLLVHMKYRKWPVVYSSVNISLLRENLATLEPNPLFIGSPSYENIMERARKVSASVSRKRKSVFASFIRLFRRKNPS